MRAEKKQKPQWVPLPDKGNAATVLKEYGVWPGARLRDRYGREQKVTAIGATAILVRRKGWGEIAVHEVHRWEVLATVHLKDESRKEIG